MRAAFEALGAGGAINQPRRRLMLRTGSILHQMAASWGDYFGTKIYSTHVKHGAHFIFILYDAATALPLAQMEANYLGQIRTGAASGLATDLLSAAGASSLGLIGERLSGVDAVGGHARGASSNVGKGVQPVGGETERIRGTSPRGVRYRGSRGRVSGGGRAGCRYHRHRHFRQRTGLQRVVGEGRGAHQRRRGQSRHAQRSAAGSVRAGAAHRRRFHRAGWHRGRRSFARPARGPVVFVAAVRTHRPGCGQNGTGRRPAT